MELIAANALYFRAKKGSIFYLLPKNVQILVVSLSIRLFLVKEVSKSISRLTCFFQKSFLLLRERFFKFGEWLGVEF